MPSARGYLPVEGVETYYEADGEGEPMLLLHGGLGSVEDFASQTAEFAKRYRVFAFERPGHGHTADLHGPFSYSAMAQQTVDFMETMNLGASSIVGWSDGAIVALLVAISRPDLVKNLVSVSGNFNSTGVAPQTRRWIETLTAERFRKDQPGLVGRYDGASPDGPDHFPAVLEKTKRLWLNEPDIKVEELAKITAPTLVMAGDRDAVPIEHAAETFRRIKGAQLCIIPGTTHFLISERPEAVNRAVLDFLRATQQTNVP